MSWYINVKAARDDAASALRAAVLAEPAYNGSAAGILEALAVFGATVAQAAGHAPNSELLLSSSGHVDGNGYGNFSLSITVMPPRPAPEPSEPAIVLEDDPELEPEPIRRRSRR